ncbi:MAG: FG-GAP-like repeat-containing protein, partial [Pseudomonadota bacterium]|nr:FG-GAP-like repeat-containing protein [Pseudomonadota bacterium]
GSPYPGEQDMMFLGTTYSTGNLPTVSNFTHSAAVGDIDSDGDLDILIGSSDSYAYSVYMLENNGSGVFSINTDLPSSVGTGDGGFTSCIFVDINNDGHLDIVAGGGGTTTAGFTLLNDGTGDFSDATLNFLPNGYFGPANTTILDIQPLDINRDGFEDLILAATGQNPYYRGAAIQAFINDGTGNFTDQTATHITATQVSAATDQAEPDVNWILELNVNDVNGDGAEDIVVATRSGRAYLQPIVLLNDGAGTLSEYSGDALDDFLGFVKPVDINGDKRMDFVSSEEVYVSGAGALDPLTIKFRTHVQSAHVFRTTAAEAENYTGSSAANTMLGYAGADTLSGGGGADLIYGNKGDDRLVGGTGADTLFGGQQSDAVFGLAGADQVYGNKQNDTLHGGLGDDSLFGGQNDDVLYGQVGNDRVDGNRGDDTLYGEGGVDTFVISKGDDWVMDFAAGEDKIETADAYAAITQTVAGGNLVLTDGDGDTLTLLGVTTTLGEGYFV